MKAAALTRFGGPEVLEYRELPEPAPGPREVLVRTRAIGVNYADIYRRRGEYGVAGPAPWVLGYEAAGIVERVGSEVTAWQTGDRVAFADVPRANAEQVVAPEGKLVSLPADVSDEQAASVLLQGLTAHFLSHESHVARAGDTILIHSAASGVGRLLLQNLRAQGVRTIAIVSSPAKRDAALSAGASDVIVSSATDWKTEARRLGGPYGIDVVYDSVGSTLLDSLALVRERGTVVFYGWAGGTAPRIDPRILMDGSKRLVGGDLWSYVREPAELRQRSELVLRALASGKLVAPIAARYALKRASAAHHAVESRELVGKTLLIP